MVGQISNLRLVGRVIEDKKIKVVEATFRHTEHNTTPSRYVLNNIKYNIIFKKQKPIYINMVRDPVELFISNFYYKRRGFKSKKNSSWRIDMPETERNKTIEQCIHNKGRV